MLISEYISKDFPAFEVDSSAEEVLEIASEFGFTHVFVQKNNLFLGGICKEFLEENPDKNLEELLIHIERFAILEGGTVLDTVKSNHGLKYTF